MLSKSCQTPGLQLTQRAPWATTNAYGAPVYVPQRTTNEPPTENIGGTGIDVNHYAVAVNTPAPLENCFSW
jgi:hypothetical protein